MGRFPRKHKVHDHSGVAGLSIVVPTCTPTEKDYPADGDADIASASHRCRTDVELSTILTSRCVKTGCRAVAHNGRPPCRSITRTQHM